MSTSGRSVQLWEQSGGARRRGVTGGVAGKIRRQLTLTSSHIKDRLMQMALGIGNDDAASQGGGRVIPIDVHVRGRRTTKHGDVESGRQFQSSPTTAAAAAWTQQQGGRKKYRSRKGQRQQQQQKKTKAVLDEEDEAMMLMGGDEVPRDFFRVRRKGPEMKLVHHITMMQVMVSVIVTFVIGIMFILDPVADWQARKLGLPLLDGSGSDVVTWHQTIALPVVMAASFVAAFVQANNPRSAHRGVKTGVNYMATMESLVTEPLLMAILAVAAGVTDVFVVVCVMFAVAGAASVSFVSDVVSFVFRIHLRSDDDGGDDDGGSVETIAKTMSVVCPAPHKKLRSLATLAALVVRSFIIVVWSQNAALPGAGRMYGLTQATSGMLITTLVVYMVCDVLRLVQLNGWCPPVGAITRTNAHLVAACKFVRFSVIVATVCVLSTAILAP